MAQEQPSGEQRDPEAPQVPSRLTKFIADDLAPLVAKHLRHDLSGVHKLRLLCKKARDALDWELIIALRVRGAEAGTDAATQLRLALELARQQQAALGLAVLLGPSPAACASSTTEEAGGSTSGSAQTPLLPALRRLVLGPNLDTLPLALAAALRAATQLRALRLHLDLSLDSAATSLRRLSGMTRLDTLELASRNASRPPGQRFTTRTVASFGAALAPLGGSLRSLAISFEHCDFISASIFTALRGLQELRLGGATVLASSLSALTSLTRLHAGGLTWTRAEAEAGKRFRLPRQLRALRLLRRQAVEVLAAFMPPPSLTEVVVGEGQTPDDGVVRLCLSYPTSYNSDGQLSAAGEEALCRAAALLSAAHTVGLDGAAWGNGGGPRPLLLPTSVPPAAPGFEGHGRWLSAWGANGIRHLVLWGVALSAGDLVTIARSSTRMQSLSLVRCAFPVGALPALAALLHLIGLRLEWRQGAELPDGLEGALRRLRALAPKLRLVVQQGTVTFVA